MEWLAQGRLPWGTALPNAVSPAALYTRAAKSGCPQARSSPDREPGGRLGRGTEGSSFHSTNTNLFLLLCPSQIPSAYRHSGSSKGFNKKGKPTFDVSTVGRGEAARRDEARQCTHMEKRRMPGRPHSEPIPLFSLPPMAPAPPTGS